MNKYEQVERERNNSGFLCVTDILEWKSRDSRAFLRKSREKYEQIKKVEPGLKACLLIFFFKINVY